MFPAFRVALQRQSIENRLADDEDESKTTLAVVTHLGIARCFWTSLAWMARSLTSVLARFSLLHTSLPTAFLHKDLNTFEALTFLMTDLLADVPTFERDTASLSTLWSLRAAVKLLVALFSTTTGLWDQF